jgi:hypothetical protein
MVFKLSFPFVNVCQSLISLLDVLKADFTAELADSPTKGVELEVCATLSRSH